MTNSLIYDAHTLDAINKARSTRPNGRKLRRKEKSLENDVQREFDGQKAFILEEFRKLSGGKKQLRRELKDVDSDLDGIFDNIDPDILIGIVIDHSKDAMQFGADYRIKTDKLSELGISFDLTHPMAVQYLETDRPLILSSLADTTKNEIKPILLDALTSGQSYNTTAQILADTFAFSHNRSLMIAVNEIGHAYEWGNYVPMKELHDKGYKVEKEWLTVGDNRVTPECMANQRMGWIGILRAFDSGDDTSPRDTNPRCRCTTKWQYK